MAGPRGLSRPLRCARTGDEIKDDPQLVHSRLVTNIKAQLCTQRKMRPYLRLSVLGIHLLWVCKQKESPIKSHRTRLAPVERSGQLQRTAHVTSRPLFAFFELVFSHGILSQQTRDRLQHTTAMAVGLQSIDVILPKKNKRTGDTYTETYKCQPCREAKRKVSYSKYPIPSMPGADS